MAKEAERVLYGILVGLGTNEWHTVDEILKAYLKSERGGVPEEYVNDPTVRPFVMRVLLRLEMLGLAKHGPTSRADATWQAQLSQTAALAEVQNRITYITS